MRTLNEVLSNRPYPGRGCIAAKARNGEFASAYFLTGRSPASRAREMVVSDDGILIRSTVGDSDDPLRHYAAAVRRGRWTVVGNGDQVEAIADALAAGASLTDAAADHNYEPDGPIFTSRIWMIHEAERSAVHLGFVRRSARSNGAPDRFVWSLDDLCPGEGVVMTTYDGTTTDVTSANHPIDVTITASNPSELAAEVWEQLSPDVRVGLFVIRPDMPAARPVMISR